MPFIALKAHFLSFMLIINKLYKGECDNLGKNTRIFYLIHIKPVNDVPRREIFTFGSVTGILFLVLQIIEYKTLVRDISLEAYGFAIAGCFLLLGIWAGSQLARKPAHLPVLKQADEKTPASFLPDATPGYGLSPREKEVLHLMAQGCSNHEIAERLFVSLSTVKTHASNVYLKLDVKRRTQAIKKAQEEKLLA